MLSAPYQIHIIQPKGALLYGPPGTGKTLLVRAVVHHTDCKFVRVRERTPSIIAKVMKRDSESNALLRVLFK